MIYLDNAATTLKKPLEVYQRMDKVNRNLSVNVGRGSYCLAQKANEIVEDTREKLKQLIGAVEETKVIFTASATLAFNMIIGGLPWKKEDIVYVSSYEHNAVMRTLYGVQKRIGFSIIELPMLGENWEIDLEKTKYMFSAKPPAYLFLTYVSNVTGYILPVEKLSKMAKNYNSTVIIDAAQALGAIPIEKEKIPVDFLVFAGHKAMHGPFGVGGFYQFTDKIILANVFFGGTGSDSLNLEMPEGIQGYEPGSVNIVSIAGLQAAIEELIPREKRICYWEKEKELIKKLVGELEQINGIMLYKASNIENQAGVISINLEGYQAQEVGRILDEDFQIAVRTGYHCVPLIHKYLQDKSYNGTVRISTDRYTTDKDINAILSAITELAEH